MRNSAKMIADHHLAMLAVVLTTTGIVYFQMQHLTAAAAFHGFSPTALAQLPSLLPGFAPNYPSGQEQLLKSLPMQIYPALGKLGVSGNAIYLFMVSLEPIALIFGGYTATRLLNPGAPAICAWLVGLFLISGHLLNADLSSWFFPFYGATYSYAYGLGLAGAAFAITTRTALGAALLAFSILSHPIIGMLCSVFAALAILADIRRYRLVDLGVAAVVALAITGSWFVFTFANADVASASVPADEFIPITRMMSYHWFPINLGVFTAEHHRHFLPFLTFCLLLIAFLFADRPKLAGIDRQLALGFVGLFVLSIVGVFLSEYSGSVLLVKLALGRASLALMVFGTIIVVPGLWKEIVKPTSLPATIAATVLLLLPFFIRYGVPVAWAGVIALPLMVTSLSADRRSQRSVMLTGAITCVVVVIVLLWVQGYLKSWSSDAYTGYDQLASYKALLLIGLAGLGTLIGHRLTTTLAAVAIASVLWTPTVARLQTEASVNKANDYLAVQLWARDNTRPGALFMPDPAHAYGWRQYSQRPSFGSLREWLYAGWIYDTKKSTFDEGKSRAEHLGIDLTSALARDRAQPNWGKIKLRKVVRGFYYSAERAWFEKTAEKYGIDYFIFDKKFMKKSMQLNTVFENEHYAVGRVR